jgi:hypothetical protein
MIIEDFLQEKEVVDASAKKEVTRHITDNMVDKIIHLIKHRKKKVAPEMKPILYALKQAGIAEEPHETE